MDLSGLLSDDDARRIAQLVEMFDRSGLGYLRLEAAGLTLSLSKQEAPCGEGAIATGPSSDHALAAPRLGVYRAVAGEGEDRAPGIGAYVERDTVLGHIDVLGQMHPVTAGVGGRISAICVAEGGFVEFGQTLYRIALPGEDAAAAPGKGAADGEGGASERGGGVQR